MKKIALLVSLLLVAAKPIFAQIPIVYYDFENNATRGTFQNAVEMSVNTPPAGAVFTYVTSAAGACNTIGCSNGQGMAGAGLIHGGSIDGSTLTVGAWFQGASDPGTGATSYYQFVANTSGFNGISLMFDAKYGGNNSPTAIGVLISNNGTTWNLVGSSTTTNGNAIPNPAGNNAWSATTGNFNLSAAAGGIANNNATLYIRIYAWGATGGGAAAYLSLDNVTLFATSTVAGKVFTTLDENNYAQGYSSGASGTALGRGSFTATGAGTNVTINGTSGLRMNSGQTFSVASSAAITFGSTGTLLGTGGIFNIASGCSLTTSNAGGMVSSIATTGTNVYTAGANYTFNAATTTPFPTGTFGNPANVTINPGAGNTVTLNVSPTVTGVLSFTNGKLAIGGNTLTLSGTVSGTSATNVITGGAASNLAIGGTGAFGTIFMDQGTDGTSNNLATLTLNRTSSGTMTLGNKLVSGTACNLTNGTVLMNGQSLVLNGTFSGSASGFLTGSPASTLAIGGSGALGTLFFDQGTPGTTNALSSFTLNRAASGIATLGNALSIGSGGLALTNGTIADGGNIITLAGNITGTGAHSGSGKISMTGSGSTISSASLGNLELNNAGGFSLSGSPSIGGTLAFISGKLTLGANNLVLGIASAISGTPSASSMIVANSTGQVRKLFSANGSFSFPVGDNTNYSPITVNFTGGSYAVGAYCAVNVKTVKHPNNANATDYLNRYWPVVTSGITSPVYAVTSAVYVPGDVSGTEANISTGQYTGVLPWIKFGVTNTGTHTLSSGSVTSTSSDFTGITTAAPSVSSTANTAICGGGSLSLAASGGTGDPTLAYTWAPAAGLSSTVGSSVTATPTGSTTYTLTITDGNGFTATATTAITVNPAPSITGNTTGICIGATNALGGSPAGGTWLSSDDTKATVGPSGTVSGVAAGTATIAYTASPGCVATTEVTVLPLPAAITGNPSVCTGATTLLGHPVASGTWVSSDLGKATVNSSGLVSGVLAGTSVITYTLPSGCAVTQVVTVQPVPAAITGTPTVCFGQITSLGHPVGGGTWVSSNTTNAPVNSSGIVSGSTVGTATITYTVPAGCITTQDVTVNPLPPDITGPSSVCEESTITLTNASPGGNWNCFPSGTATVNSSGDVTGVAAGNATVVYTLSTGCSASTTVTVNISPAAISGTPQVCEGSFTVLSSSPSGGIWSSSAPATGTVNTTGIVAGLAAGNTNIQYTIGSCSRSAIVTVNELPAPITGDLEICVDASTPLSSISTGGTWVCELTSHATIAINTGVLLGVAMGTTNVTYTMPTGCQAYAVATIDPLPAAITGLNEVCVNNTTTLFSFTTGGTWSSAAIGTATVNATTGDVTGIADGVTSIIYTLPTGCAGSTQFSVNPLPASLTGNAAICLGSTNTLTSTSVGGTWESSNPGVANVDGSGNVNGVSLGTANITYALSTGCITTTQVTVVPLPAPIGGPNTVCVSSQVTLTSADAGGTWGTGDATVTAGVLTGIITGVSQGTATITYTYNGCYTTAVRTVEPLPVAIAGLGGVCEAGSVITLTNTDAGGTWSSPDATVTVGASSGEVTGISSGTATISYTLPTGCSATKQITINVLPSPITGPSSVCTGFSITLSSATPGVTWSGSNASVATISASGVVTGLAVGMIIFECFDLNGCSRSATVSVNPLPAPIGGNIPVCVGGIAALTNATPGGTWACALPGTIGVDALGNMIGVSAGNAQITYTSPLGCFATVTATVNSLPAAILGPPQLCQGSTLTLTDATPGGVWSSSVPANATVDAITGLVTGILPGNAVISYTLSTGCSAEMTLTINPTPSAITGDLDLCVGAATPLISDVPGGGWSCAITDGPSVSGTGIFTSSVAGSFIVTYTTPYGCHSTTLVTVEPLPAAITGIPIACKGQGTALGNADAGGTWSTSLSTIAGVDALGNVTGMSAGTARISYTLPTGCASTVIYTVNPLPTAFAGGMQVCEGLSHNLANTLTGGTWLSGDGTIADITPGGMLSGILAGTAEVTYTLPTGCTRVEVATVNPAVPSITGTPAVCIGLTTTLSNAAPGGVWISTNTAAATADLFTGVISGINAGTSKITYALPTGCMNTTIVTVNSLPASITGTMNICAGQTTTLHDVTIGGSWSGGITGIASIGATGIVSSIAAGVVPFTYMLPTGCLRTANVTVNALPVDETITGGGNYCAGTTGVHIGLAATEPATTYRLYRGSSIVGIVTGSGPSVDFGAYTAVATYTVRATAIGTGCVSGMTGSTVVGITPLVVPSVTIASDHGDTTCVGVATTFTAMPVNGGLSPAYQWKVNSAAVGIGNTFSYTPVDGDTVKALLTSSAACPSLAVVTGTKKMTVWANQSPAIVIGKTSGDTICQLMPASFHAVSTWGGDAPVYTWRRNSTDVGTGADYTYIPSDGDIISCRLTSNYRCRLATTVVSSGVTLDVDSVYVPGVTINASPALTVRPNTDVTLTAAVTNAGPAPVYEWRLNGSPIPGASTAVLVSTFADNDVVTCLVYGSGPCGLPSFNMVTIRIDENAELAVAHAGSAIGEIRLMPNPNSGTFTIEGGASGSEDVVLEVINVLGKSVYSKKVMVVNGTFIERIDLDNNLAEGIYMVSATSGADRKIQHFIIRK